MIPNRADKFGTRPKEQRLKTRRCLDADRSSKKIGRRPVARLPPFGATGPLLSRFLRSRPSMSRSANPADFSTFVPDDDPKRKGAAFPHGLLAQQFRKEEDRLAPSIGVRRRWALESHLRIHAAYYVIIGRHGAIYVGDARGFTSADTGHRGVMQRRDKQGLEPRYRLSPGGRSDSGS